MPLNKGVAARWRRMCMMPRRSSRRATLLSTSSRSTFRYHSKVSGGSSFPVSKKCFTSRKSTAGRAAATDHDGIHSVAVKAFLRPYGRGDVTVANDRDVHARVVFHFADQRPVGFSRVHLCTGASVDGQCGNAQSCNCSARSTMILGSASQPSRVLR